MPTMCLLTWFSMEKIRDTPVLSATDQALLSTSQAWHYRAVAIDIDDQVLIFTDGQGADAAEEELELLLGRPVSVSQVDTDTLTRCLHAYYPQKRDAGPETPAYTGNSQDFLPHLIREARQLKSSDIHLESYESRCRIRIRIDGQMIERYVLQKTEYPALINKIKIQAGLDIAEKRLPQDGRIHFTGGGQAFDIRVSVLPTLYGEKVVLRLLSGDAAEVDLEHLGFSTADLRTYLEGVKRPNGMILISGPTGSGKTTTLYATLKLLNKSTRNILTIEDPVEYTLEGINQVQLRESIGLTFAAALRTFLRQDPDIIMVGEIRDVETASMAVRASLTGHLVLSTIHTNSAWGTVSRLIDMGVPPFLLSNTLNVTAAQRLLRLLCPACKKQETLDISLYPRSFRPYRRLDAHFTAAGCEHCHHTGYRGRKAIYEIAGIDTELAAHIRTNSPDVQDAFRERGIKTLSENAFDLFAAGDTSLEEIFPLLTNC